MATQRLKVTGGYIDVEVEDTTGGDAGTPPIAAPGDPATAPIDTGAGTVPDPATVPTMPDVPIEPPATDPTVDPTTGQPTEQPTEPAGPPYTGELRRDDHQHTPDEQVRTWQQAIADAGVDTGKVDGFFGPRTESGVITVQNACGLPATGVIDAETWRAGFTLGQQ